MEAFGEGSSCAVEFAADGIDGLVGDCSDILITERFIGDQEEEQAIFRWEGVERFLYDLAELLGFQQAQRGMRTGTGGLEESGVALGEDVSLLPALEQVLAVIDGDAVETGADG